MHWLFLLMAVAALFGAVRTTSSVTMVVLLLLSFGLMAAWILGWLSARLGNTRDERPMIDPMELKRLRDLADARRQQQAAAGNNDQVGNS